jgi:transposase
MSAAKPRLMYANRCQCEMRDESLDQLLPPEHPVRDVWEFVAALDLSALLASIRSVPGRAGAPAIDPRILMALWLQATIDGVGSSRSLAELCEHHLAYQWLCGGVEVGYHTLADFRTGHGEVLNQLLTQTVAVLLHEGLIDLQRVAQDGMRVRASAGASSFRGGKTIAACLEEAQEQVEALQSQADEDAGAASRREQSAQQRAATERVASLQAAQVELKKLQDMNATQPKCRQKEPGQVRASTTDPECRKMKMPDGGFRPAYNVQFATTTEGGVIVGVAVTNEGTDSGQMPPMLEQIEERCQEKPAEMLVDGGFATVDAIDEAERNGTKVYAPPKEEKEQLDAGKDPYARKKSDTDATAPWRERMGTAEAKLIYKLRASTAEWVNAHARNRGLYGVTVRGQPKVLVVVLWYALAHNFGRMKKLRAATGEESARRAEPRNRRIEEDERTAGGE